MKTFYALKMFKSEEWYKREQSNCAKLVKAFGTWEKALDHGILLPQHYEPSEDSFVLPLMQESLEGARYRWNAETDSHVFNEYTILKCLECLVRVH